MKICIISEDVEFRNELTKAIESFGHGMTVCGSTSSGALGLKLIEQSAPDLTVLDTVLSEVDGISLLEQIQALRLKTMTVVVSFVGNANIVQKATSLGAHFYIVRPTKIENIVKRIYDLSGEEQSLAKTDVTLPKEPVDVRVRNDSPKTPQKSIDEKISNIFITIGIPPHIRGYQYLREAIKLAVENPYIINNITKKLYPEIADAFQTTPSKVERAIRHSIEVAWNRGRVDNLNNIFGVKVYTGSQKPTNGEFIALIADKLLLEGA